MYGLFRVSALLAVVVSAMSLACPAHAARIKDIAEVKGVRDNQLIGYGLVIGLNGTGDSNNVSFTSQSVNSMLKRMGLQVGAGKLDTKNVAAVVVTAVLPPFANTGDKTDVLVSSVGDAKSLQGGTLLMTPLKAANGGTYAVAQGVVSLGGGFSAEGASSSVQKNHPTAGRITGGALVEKTLGLDFSGKNSLSFSLRNPDFTTAARVAEAINRELHTDNARAVDASTVTVGVPGVFEGRAVEFMARLEGIEIVPDYRAKVVLNERTGTVVMGDSVRISTVAVSHGNLTIEISTDYKVSQPLPFSETGDTVTVPSTNISAKEQKAHLILLPNGASIGEVVRALNAVGTTPRDLIAILQAVKAAGALQAELELL